MNAYEERESIIVDIAAYADASFIQELYLDQLTGSHGGATSCGELRRYRLSLRGSSVEEAVLSSQSIELPRINYHQSNTQPYRFAYGVSKRQDHLDDFWNQLVKIDVQARTSRTWFQDGCYPGEPIFVASPQARHEDDGVILSVVLDAQKGTSFLLLLDTASFEEQGRAEVPHPIPFGFHGIYSNHAGQAQELQI